MEHSKHRDCQRMTSDAVHQDTAPVLLGEPVAMSDEHAASTQVELGFAAEELDAEVLSEERAAPAVVISSHERDRYAACPDLLELGDRGKMFAGYYAAILEPEVEKIAGDHQVITGARDFLQKRMERLPDGGGDLAEVRVGDDDHTGFAILG